VAIAFEKIARKRERECRLDPERALETLDDAEAFVEERGMLTLMPDCSLPSLFGACHEEPYSDSPGFGSWPKTKYWWGVALPALATRLHRGKRLYVSAATAAVLDPLCRAELRRAEQGEYGGAAARVLAHLAETGPALVEEVSEEVGLENRVRERLERVGALVSQSVTLEEPHRHTSELRRWDQAVEPSGRAEEGALADLLVEGVRAAVLAPEREALRWFSWTIPPEALEDERLAHPRPGWVALA
jgi:hypothetical protein